MKPDGQEERFDDALRHSIAAQTAHPQIVVRAGSRRIALLIGLDYSLVVLLKKVVRTESRAPKLVVIHASKADGTPR
jgi:hypothetical protein